MTYGIMAHRSAGSVFGAAVAPLKSNGVEVTFETREEAEKEAQRLTDAMSNRYVVWYTVYEL